MRVSRLALALLIPALLLLADPGQGAGRNELGEASLHEVGSEPKAVRSYWTRQRMQDAEPLDALEVTPAQAGSTTELRSGPPTTHPASPPSSARRSSEAITGFRERAAAPIPYTRGAIADPSPFPYRTNGRLFGVAANGQAYSCSATAVAAQNRSLVFTAGHCAYLVEVGGFADLLEFVPGYHDGTAPYGEWPALEYWLPGGWVSYELPSFDMAALVIAPNEDGMRLEDLVGGRGIGWNLSRSLQFDAFGYPAAPPFTGEQLTVCESQYGLEDPLGFTTKPRTTAIGCDMNEGSSGGGWIIRDTYLNGVNSYGIYGLPEVLFGPYFGDATANLYGTASTSTSPGPLPPELPAAPLVGTIHPMGLSLRLAQHLVARGQMSAPDGYVACTRGAPVGIFHRGRGGWDLVKVTTTRQNGSFSVRVRDLTGRYVAFSPEGSVDDLNVCAEIRSQGERHR